MSPPSSRSQVLSHELAASSDVGGSSREHTPQTARKLFPGGEGSGGGKGLDVSVRSDLQLEGFESRPSSRVMKEVSTTPRDNLHTELSGQESSRRDGSHDTHVTSSGSHVTGSEPANTALSHLTNDILTYSNQVAMTTTDSTSSASQSTWLPSSRDDILRPSSPMAVSRVFKVVFLGKKFITVHTMYVPIL